MREAKNDTGGHEAIKEARDQFVRDARFREELGLAAVNSINWARIMAQIVYYVSAAVALGAPEREVAFAVPTGNFGNIYAAYAARALGVPIQRLIVGSNRNDILTRFFESGSMRTADVHPTLSPSMDIQVSSNFERLLFEMNGRDGGLTAEQLQRFRSSGRLDVEADQYEHWISPVFRAARFDDTDTLRIIGDVERATGEIIDPHTAVGIGAARAHRIPGVPMVTTATAHAAKFPDAVERATGHRPGLPPHLADLWDRPERTQVLPNDLAAVQRFVESVAR